MSTHAIRAHHHPLARLALATQQMASLTRAALQIIAIMERPHSTVH